MLKGDESVQYDWISKRFLIAASPENNDVPRLKNQLGHSSIQTTMISTHLTDEEMRNAVNNMDK